MSIRTWSTFIYSKEILILDFVVAFYFELTLTGYRVLWPGGAKSTDTQHRKCHFLSLDAEEANQMEKEQGSSFFGKNYLKNNALLNHIVYFSTFVMWFSCGNLWIDNHA